MVLETMESELREGNFIFYSGEVLQLNHKNIDLVYTKGVKFLEGIEINVNWLENFGFFYINGSGDNSTFFQQGVKVELSDDLSTVYIHSLEIRKIKYVHELQNLFFALTGNELVYRDAIHT